MSHKKKASSENADFYITIAHNIAYYRRLAGYTQAMLAEIIDISTPYMGALESTKNPKRCSIEVLFCLARALNVEPYQLLEPLDEDRTHPIVKGRPRKENKE